MGQFICTVFLCCTIYFLTVALPSVAPAAEPPARPVIDSTLRNGASMSDYPFTRIIQAGLAPGSIFVVFGSGLGPTELAQGTLPYSMQLPAGPSRTHISFRSVESGEMYEAPLLHSWSTQVAGIISSQLPLGTVEIVISYTGVPSEPLLMEIVEVRPGLFTVS
jgi:hypothetical protein